MATEIDVLFRGFSAPERAEFLALGESMAFAAGEVILPAGRSEWDTYIVQEGEVSIWVGNARLADLGPGQTIGTSAILFPQLQWSAVRSKTKSILLRIPREELMAFFASHPQRRFQQFCVNLFKIWVEVLNQRNRRIAEIQRKILNASSSRWKNRFKLLVVDDEIEILNLMEEFFQDCYDVVTAKDGREALDRTLTEKPDLILLDLRLPELDGFDVCKRLKIHPEAGHIPIVMVSALNTIPDKVKGMMYGADEYLTKPVDLQQLDDIVKRILVKVYGEPPPPSVYLA